MEYSDYIESRAAGSTPLTGAEKLAVSQGGSAVQITAQDIADIAGGGGHVIEDEGTPLTQRTKLNFVGAGVTVTDDSVDDATVVTIPSGGGTPGGSDTQIQFNDGGAFGGDSGATFNKTTNVATFGGLNVSGLTASEIVATDSSKNLVSTSIDTDLIEMAYISSNYNYTQK